MVTSIVLAGGGTAGHTSPLIATAKELSSLADVRLLAIGTAKGLETTVIPAAGLELALIDPVPLPRTVNLDLVKLPYTLTKAVRQARRILKRADADVLVGPPASLGQMPGEKVGPLKGLLQHVAGRLWGRRPMPVQGVTQRAPLTAGPCQGERVGDPGPDVVAHQVSHQVTRHTDGGELLGHARARSRFARAG